MDQRGRRTVTRLLAAVGAVGGAVLLAEPQEVVDRLCPDLPHNRVWLARVLGARMLLQNVALLVRPTGGLVRVMSAVDLLHAASMVPFVGSARAGRAAQISGAVAAGYAVVAMAAAPRSERG